MSYAAARQVSSESGRLFEMFLMIWKRIRERADGTHYIVVVYLDAAHALSGWYVRRYGGINRLSDSVPIDAIKDALMPDLLKGVPRSQLGLSTFAYNKLVKAVCRLDLGLCEMDLKSSSLQTLLHGHPASEFPLAHHFVMDKEKKAITKLALELEVPVDESKKFFLSMVQSKPVAWCLGRRVVSQGMLDYLLAFEEELNSLRSLHKEAHSVQYEAFDFMGTFIAFFSQSVERAWVDSAIEVVTAASKQFFSFEHDGFVCHAADGQQLLRPITLKTGAVWMTKPQLDRADIMKEAQLKYPDYAWSVECRILDSASFFHKVSACMNVLGDTPACRMIDTVFSAVVATCVDGKFHNNLRSYQSPERLITLITFAPHERFYY